MMITHDELAMRVLCAALIFFVLGCVTEFFMTRYMVKSRIEGIKEQCEKKLDATYHKGYKDGSESVLKYLNKEKDNENNS